MQFVILTQIPSREGYPESFRDGVCARYSQEEILKVKLKEDS